MGSWWQAKLIENSADLVAKDIALELLKTSSSEKKNTEPKDPSNTL
ncbi:MAG: hypothetical protein ACK5T0_03865 [Vampirovibrionales bacterium]